MKLATNTVLITGGASGIGLALAQRLLAAGSTVIICGRRAEALEAAKAAHSELHTRVCDVGDAGQRQELVAWATSTFPELNVLVNNAGIQQRIALTAATDWEAQRHEIAINLDAPIHLSQLLIGHLRGRPGAAICNVTSGLAFVPLVGTPVYSATKAALHSFTLSLRRQLMGSGIEVVEIIPPAVNTDLGGPGLHTFGVDVNAFADAVAARIDAGDVEIAYGFSQQSSQASPTELAKIFERMNQREPAA